MVYTLKFFKKNKTVYGLILPTPTPHFLLFIYRLHILFTNIIFKNQLFTKIRS